MIGASFSFTAQARLEEAKMLHKQVVKLGGLEMHIDLSDLISDLTKEAQTEKCDRNLDCWLKVNFPSLI